MLFSKYIGIFKNPVKTWEKQLNTIAERLKLWFLVQRKWMYLESIFVGADNIRLKLPEEAKKFDDDELISIMGSSNPSSIEPHLLKVFDNVKHLGLGHGKKIVVNMESSEKESFHLVCSVAIDNSVELWMTKVEEEMKQSLCSITKEAILIC
eukprot:2746820-Ditylum_brightwellii.AAC.1